MAALLTVECLWFAPTSPRAQEMLVALTHAARPAGLTLHATQRYEGRADWLLLWGPGAPNRFDAMRQQLARGGHVIALDLAYWRRDEKIRVSIDAAHPPAWVMRRDWPASRLEADDVSLESAWDPDGPAIVAGLGDKARVQYGAGAIDLFEADMIAALRARGRDVRYRPKRPGGRLPAGVPLAPTGPIEHSLRGASLVATWHSNVAVDAIRLGVPAVCRDGAAAAVCPGDLPPAGTPVEPLPADLRARFLANLAWFQWAPCEAGACWRFLRELLA